VLDALILILWIVLWIYAFVDAIMADPAKVRVMPKAVWVILILIFADFAGIPWLLFGRPKRDGSRAGGSATSVRRIGWQAGGAAEPGPRRSAPLAPDDNPEFLRQLRSDIKRDKRDKPGRGDPDQPSS
jgi:Phospholipase_D-nuclease N-terminal